MEGWEGAPRPHGSSPSAPQRWGWGEPNASPQATGQPMPPWEGWMAAGTPRAHRGLPVGVGEDPVDLHVAAISCCHVHPQPLAACSPWPIGAGHVVAVVVLLQWGQGQNQHRWGASPQGCKTHGHHLIAEQWKWSKNAPCEAAQGLSSWRGVEEPRVRRSAGRREM